MRAVMRDPAPARGVEVTRSGEWDSRVVGRMTPPGGAVGMGAACG